MRFKSHNKNQISQEDDVVSVEVGAMFQAPGDGQAVWFTTNRITVKATAEQTGGAFGLWEALAAPGSSPPMHIHHAEDESFWVLEGVMTVFCGDETITAGPGSFVFLPRDVPHTFVVEGDEPARFLGLSTPAGAEGYFLAVGSEPEHDGLPPRQPLDIALLQRWGQPFGLEIVGPPKAPTGA